MLLRLPRGWPRLREYQKVAAHALASGEKQGLWMGGGLGKAQPVDCLVLTPTGWCRIGDLSVGAAVADPDGGVGQVLGVFPQGLQEVVRLTTSRRSSTQCTLDHLWLIQTRYDKKVGRSGRVVPTHYMTARRLKGKSSHHQQERRYTLPVAGIAAFSGEAPPVPPYLLGVLLGDGCLSSGCLRIANSNTYVEQRLHAVCQVVRQADKRGGGVTLAIHESTSTGHVTRECFAGWGLLRVRAEGKLIPEECLRAPVEYRRTLLEGLMDTDGTIDTAGSIEYTTVSEKLAAGVADLVRGLGGVATISLKAEPRYFYLGEYRVGQPAYRVFVRMPFCPFSTPDKVGRWRPQCVTDYVDSIEPTGTAECVCIAVSTARGLYVTDDGIVTHNTSAVLSALHLRALHGGPCLFVTRAIGRGVWPRDAKWVLGPDYTPAILRAGKVEGSGCHEDARGTVTYTSLPLALSRHPGISINYELLESRYDELARVQWKAVIYDEAHQLKGGFLRQHKDRDGNPIMRRYDYAKLLARAAHSRGAPVWQATATPIRDRRRDLWSQLDIAQPGRWGNSAWNFLHHFCDAFIDDWGGLDSTGESNTPELEARLDSIFVRLSRDAVADELPKLQRDVREITPRNVNAHLAGGGIEDAIERAARAKIEDACDLVADYLNGDGKVVVVVNRRRLAGLVGQYVRACLKDLPRQVRDRANVIIVDGSIDPVKREAIVDAFNRQPTPGVLVAVTDSIGESINLHLCDAAIVLSLPYTPGALEQFEMRLARLGGKACVIHYLVAVGTIDEEVRSVLLDKLEDVMDLGADTQGGDAIRRQLAGLDDEERVLSQLRSWLSEAG